MNDPEWKNISRESWNALSPEEKLNWLFRQVTEITTHMKVTVDNRIDRTNIEVDQIKDHTAAAAKTRK